MERGIRGSGRHMEIGRERQRHEVKESSRMEGKGNFRAGGRSSLEVSCGRNWWALTGYRWKLKR